MRRLAVLATLSVTTLLLVHPASASAEGIISSLSVSPSTVRDGASAQGTVTLLPDATPTTVLLFSSDPSVATVPSSVVAPAGQSTVSFTITTNAAAPPTIVQITAAVQNIPRTANLSVNAATPPGPSLSSVSVSPSSLTGGSPATGTVTFTGATDGAVVQLSSSDPTLVQVPSETVVSGGASSGAFAVTTSAVAATTTVTITARWFAVTRTTTITLTPGTPAPADRVAITKARWKARLLTIEATSTNPNAILSVYSQSGAFMFTLTNKGGGRYADQRGWVFNPQVVTVRSNLGGSATATLTS
ncbi:hypothetical protein KZZ52_26900 [Dactylosporangium sp. AC04546]|uniref:hypothetical protein n=1 Tax=Dactylosporangium sp. AC04546 TaxID=2862460 RepID=UPI001EDEC12D|nr:hypothetical protein [Dactylosporangium sp. AC04546]WVK88895.1 hypothetical protein KZZ52_26900 [Dactylosporangium sp. AC04546]